MRPHSDARLDLAAALVDGGGTTRDLAVRTGLAISVVRETLNNMARAGDARKRDVRVPGVCRPVPFYERAWRQCDARPFDDVPLRSLIAMWVGATPSPEPMEASM
jgi:hypothetical protein